MAGAAVANHGKGLQAASLVTSASLRRMRPPTARAAPRGSQGHRGREWAGVRGGQLGPYAEKGGVGRASDAHALGNRRLRAGDPPRGHIPFTIFQEAQVGTWQVVGKRDSVFNKDGKERRRGASVVRKPREISRERRSGTRSPRKGQSGSRRLWSHRPGL